jgi:lipopolysaccharide transport system ATP-binding protein
VCECLRIDIEDMGEEIAISLKNVSKCFKRYNRPVDRLKEILLPGNNRSQEFWALRDIQLEIPRGQTVGIVGRNGSGKSTLLQIIAGTLTPTTGEVQVHGRVSALLELGSGFNPEFTGRQNVFFNGQILGLSQSEIEEKFDEIASFADIGDFIDQPVKTYSSGMFVRLAFAVAVNVNPEVLIVDEALAVGDIAFQHRCMRRMRNLMDSGVTTLFVSHDAGSIKTLCNSAVMIHDGEIQSIGIPNLVISHYLKTLSELEVNLDDSVDKELTNIEEKNKFNIESQNDKSKLLVEAKPIRRGNSQAFISQVKILNLLNEDLGENPVFDFNETIKLFVEVETSQMLKECIIGFFICDKNGNEIIGTNSFEENHKIENIEANSKLQLTFEFKLPLRASSYSLTVAVTESYTSMMSDWIDNAIVFQVLPPHSGKRIHSLVEIPIHLESTKISPYTPQVKI